MDLKKEIENALENKNDYGTNGWYLRQEGIVEELMALFDSHTRSVIGDNEKLLNNSTSVYAEVVTRTRNQLRKEQRSKLSPRGKEKVK